MVKLGQLERVHLPKVVREGDVFLSRSGLGGYTFLEYWKAHARGAFELYNTLVEIDEVTSKQALVFPESYIEEYRGLVEAQCVKHGVSAPKDFMHPFGKVKATRLPLCPNYPDFFWTNMFTGCDKIIRKAEDVAESEDGNGLALWVQKLGGPDNNRWQKRYIVITGGYLEYYDNDTKINTRFNARKPKGAIPLLYVTQILHSKRNNGFKVRRDAVVLLCVRQPIFSLFDADRLRCAPTCSSSPGVGRSSSRLATTLKIRNVSMTCSVQSGGAIPTPI